MKTYKIKAKYVSRYYGIITIDDDYFQYVIDPNAKTLTIYVWIKTNNVFGYGDKWRHRKQLRYPKAFIFLVNKIILIFNNEEYIFEW